MRGELRLHRQRLKNEEAPQAYAQGRRTFRNWRSPAMIARIATTALGIVFFLYGVIAAISPLPVGVPFAIIGLFMIAGANPAFRPVIRSMRRRWRWFDKLVRMVAPRTSGVVRDVIAETDPAGQDQGETAAFAKNNEKEGS